MSVATKYMFINQKMARPRGFEPLTFGFGGQHSIQLSYGRKGGYNTLRNPFRLARGLLYYAGFVNITPF